MNGWIVCELVKEITLSRVVVLIFQASQDTFYKSLTDLHSTKTTNRNEFGV